MTLIKVERLRIEIYTEKDTFGFDQTFTEGMNFIVSEQNTFGKSSILLGIYYGLGLEEIVGGQGSKVLTPVFKEFINVEGKDVPVIESKVYLEITNGSEVITVFRTGKSFTRDDKLLTVYNSSINELAIDAVNGEDYYVQLANSAINKKGFHTYLEEFIGLNLPKVPTSDNVKRKLYLQLIFSCMFIEQKRGWSDYYSAMPYLGVKSAKKRIAEYVLGLEQIDNERRRSELKIEADGITDRWSKVYKDLMYDAKREGVIIENLTETPKLLKSNSVDGYKVFIEEDGKKTIDMMIGLLEKEIEELGSIKPIISENYDDLEVELEETEKSIEKLEEEYRNLKRLLNSSNQKIESLSHNLSVIISDINNNKDVQKLNKLGSEEKVKTSEGLCPLCNQAINDYVLLEDTTFNIMTVEENINHLEAQKKAMEFALSNEKSFRKELHDDYDKLNNSLMGLRRLYQTILTDIRKVDDDISETVVYKKLEMQKRFEDLSEFKTSLDSYNSELQQIADDWAHYLVKKDKLPEKGLSDNDEAKMKFFEKYFRKSLEVFRFSSVANPYSISMARDLYVPVKDKIDMKFASSASDNIRAIWSYTLGLLETSNQLGGNHPGLILIDEPAQHSIVQSDLDSLFARIDELSGFNQVIVAVTINNSELRENLEGYSENHNIISLSSKAFKRL
jgi:predicted  nucleic acid-binding Zn-ribbon protein